MKNLYKVNFNLSENKISKLNGDKFNHQVLIVMDEISSRIHKNVESQKQIEKNNLEFSEFEDSQSENLQKNFLEKNSEIIVNLEESENGFGLEIDIDAENAQILGKNILNNETLEKREIIRKKILEIVNSKQKVSQNLNLPI